MKSLAMAVLRLYKRWISPVFPPSCRYLPSCSEYALEAVDRYGVWRGGWMSAWRLLHCHPFTKGGLDPVVKAVTEPKSLGTSGAPFLNSSRALTHSLDSH
jgi:putative membrane protein insertion efficiency factor